jgi:hypothetical protein
MLGPHAKVAFITRVLDSCTTVEQVQSVDRWVSTISKGLPNSGTTHLIIRSCDKWLELFEKREADRKERLASQLR